MSGLGPNASAIRIDDEMARKIGASNAEEIKELMKAAALEQGLVTRDVMNPEVLHATPLADNAPRTVSRTLVINGVRHVLEGASDTELNQQEIQLHRRLQNPEPEQQEPPRDESGRFVSADASSAVADAVYQARWTAAAERFAEKHPDFYKSEANRDAIGNAVIAMHLDDEPTLQSLEVAYAALQRGGGLAQDPAVTSLNRDLTAAKSQQEIDEILAARFHGRNSSGVFGGR
jgi:hypothetical protein